MDNNNNRGIYDENGYCIGLKPNPYKYLIDEKVPPMGDYRWKLIGDVWTLPETEE